MNTQSNLSFSLGGKIISLTARQNNGTGRSSAETLAPTYKPQVHYLPTGSSSRSPGAGDANSGARPYPHFLDQLTELIEKNIDDEHYSIEHLCRDACASRTKIHHKVKKGTGLSTSIFIRKIRLEKAREILIATDLNITQVAYEVGFQDPRYFSRTFSKSYGICPKDFRKNYQ